MVSNTYSILLGGGTDSKNTEDFIMKLIKLLFVSTFMLFASIAYADPALLASFTICSGFDADGALYSTAGKGHTVVTDSENGNSSIHCTGTLPDGAALPQGAHHSDNASTGSLCNAAFGIGSASTSDWKSVTTPNGKYTLTCHYRQ